MYNAGDTLRARETVYMVGYQLPMLFKDKKYLIASISKHIKPEYYINTEYRKNHTFQLEHIYQYFYTKQEERKLKLNKLQQCINIA